MITPEHLHDFLTHSEIWSLVREWFVDRREQARDDVELTPDTNSELHARHKAISGFIKVEVLDTERFKEALLAKLKEQRNNNG